MGTSKYNLESLGWFNFEQLVRALLRELLGAGLSSFSGSNDQGRDATFDGRANGFPSKTKPWKGKWIIQVKHRTYSTSGAGRVRRELKRTLAEEVDKVLLKHAFECDCYLFVTNCPLSATDKDEFLAVIRARSQAMMNAAVLGEKDVDELLDQFPNSAVLFPQILGVSQVDRIVHWGIHQRSIEFLRLSRKELAAFAPTAAFFGALDLLAKQHFCVLSGPPKMGKTCNAMAIAAAFAADGYEVMELIEQRDFHKTYKNDRKQLFICDDVFGDIGLRPNLVDDWTRGLLRLFGVLGKKHKLVWTAREYILRAAVATSRIEEERPSIADVDRVVVSVDKLTRLDKAMIVYNHASRAKLPQEVREYLRGKGCLKIVDHQNYTPESIRQLCSGKIVEFFDETTADEEAIQSEIDEYLSQPDVAWKRAFAAASYGERLLCVEVMASGGLVKKSELQQRFEEQSTEREIEPSTTFSASLNRALGSFLKEAKYSVDPADPWIQFYHPSMRELLQQLIASDHAIKLSYLSRLTLTQVAELVANKVTEDVSTKSDIRAPIQLNVQEQDSLLKHLEERVLPACTLTEAKGALVVLREAVPGIEDTKAEDRPVDNSAFKLWSTTLNTILVSACSRDFWERNREYRDANSWSMILVAMRQLLPQIDSPILPAYISDVLQHHRDPTEVEYWTLVESARALTPTIVEQVVDFADRRRCRDKLASELTEALEVAEDLDLESDPVDSNYWHDHYGPCVDACESYLVLFREDLPIKGHKEARALSEDYPRLDEGEGEYDFADYSNGEASSIHGDQAILEVFSDL